MKYWNKARVRRTMARGKRRRERMIEREIEVAELRRMYAKGYARKNAGLMLHALGIKRQLRMLARLSKEGAMSVSKLAKPFGITLSSALWYVHNLERAGLITTHKRGRIRFCVYNPEAPKELALWLRSRQPFDLP
ncbi:MAG: helix-turn-helix domain-containing protein [Patescibacteria group bacterium]|nr:helix-turn-helix domain-containing protein [Patescibacteria group bacterium]